MAVLEANAADGGLDEPARTLAISAALTAFNLSTLMVSIANVALPSIARDFGIPAADAIWIITAYQLAVVAFLLPISSLADIVGYRPIYLFGLAAFLCGSMICGLSGALSAVLGGRLLQGLGAAAIQGVYVYSMASIFPRPLVGRGLGLGTMTSQVTAMLAPSIAGVILSFGTWHWLFLLAVPPGLFALVASFLVLPRVDCRAGRLKIIPVGLNIIGFIMVMLGLERISRSENKVLWGSLLAAGLLSVILQIWCERRSKTPLIPTDLFRITAFSLTMLTTFFSFGASGIALVAIPFLLQDVLHFSPQISGLLLSAWPISTAASGLIVGWWFQSTSAAKLGAGGLTAMAAGLLMLASLSDPSAIVIAICLSVCGFGFGTFVTPNVKAIIMVVPAQRSGAASGMQAVSRLLGQSIGAILVGVSLASLSTDWWRYSLLSAGIASLLGAAMSIGRRGVNGESAAK